MVFTARQKWIDCLLASMPNLFDYPSQPMREDWLLLPRSNMDQTCREPPYRDDNSGFQTLQR